MLPSLKKLLVEKWVIGGWVECGESGGSWKLHCKCFDLVSGFIKRVTGPKRHYPRGNVAWELFPL